MELDDFDRVRFLHAPTALEPLPNLTRELGGPALCMKRDDCAGLALAGNKARKLEFLLADARRHGANHLITHGAVQSNHVRQSAAAAAKIGMKFTGLIEHRLSEPNEDYLNGGNAFLVRLLGARLLHYGDGTDMNRAMQEVAEQSRLAGNRPYVIPIGGSNALGALGYVGCAQEIAQQAREMGSRIDCIVHATGSGGTQAGLVAGLQAMNSATRVLGISVRGSREEMEVNVHAMAQGAADLLGLRTPIARESIDVCDAFVGSGYGIPTAEMVEAVEMLARLEGILLDPIYTGKAMAGLLHLIRQGRFGKADVVAFVHTGGAPSLFSYRPHFDALRPAEPPEILRR